MLLVGTQILDWRWLAFLAVIGLDRRVSGSRAATGTLPGRAIARRRLQLADSLSTAWYLLSDAQRQDAIAEYQIKGAERARAKR